MGTPTYGPSAGVTYFDTREPRASHVTSGGGSASSTSPAASTPATADVARNGELVTTTPTTPSVSVGTGTSPAAGTGGTMAATGAAQAATTVAAQGASLPDTADRSSSGVLGTGLAVAGAAVLAYERRRARNEREQES